MAARTKSAKKATTKTTTKPAAKEEGKAKKPKKVAEEMAPMYNPDAAPMAVMQPATKSVDALVGRMTKSLGDLKERAGKKGVNLLTPAELRKQLIPLPDLLLQYSIGSCGIRAQTLTRIIGETGIGKSALMAYLAGWVMKHGCPVLWIDVDNKQMDPSRFVRYLGPDKVLANKLLNCIRFTQVFNIADVDNAYEVMLPEMRKDLDKDPALKGRPIFVFIEDWSSGKSKSEAAGRGEKAAAASSKTTEEGKPSAKKEKKKDVGKAENFGHSKHAQAMRRVIPGLQKQYNACFIMTGAQNDKVDMAAAPIPGMTPSKSDNTTSIGGRALPSISSYTFTVVNGGKVKNKAQRHIGDKVKMKATKNSYGPKRAVEFIIKFEDLRDTAENYETPLSFAVPTAEFFAKNKILGVKLENGLVTCRDMDLIGVTPVEFYAAFQERADLVAHVGCALGIEGYEHFANKTELGNPTVGEIIDVEAVASDSEEVTEGADEEEEFE